MCIPTGFHSVSASPCLSSSAASAAGGASIVVIMVVVVVAMVVAITDLETGTNLSGDLADLTLLTFFAIRVAAQNRSPEIRLI